MPNYQYGVDLSTTLRAGMFLTVILSEIRELRAPIDQSLLLHNIYESSPLSDKKWVSNAINENLKGLRQTLTPRIKKINEHIGLANKLLKGLDFKHLIPNIKVTDVMSVVRKRLQTLFEVEDAQKMSNEHFHMSLGHIMQKPMTEIHNFIKIVETERFIDEVKILNEPYEQGIKQALSICSIGYYSTSVFIAGKAMEEIVNDYFEELFRLRKLKRFDPSSEKFKDKIGKLYGSNEISEELFHRFSNIRIDRNEFGHPSKKILSKKQAHLRIRLIAEIIPDIEKKLKKLKSKTS